MLNVLPQFYKHTGSAIMNKKEQQQQWP